MRILWRAALVVSLLLTVVACSPSSSNDAPNGQNTETEQNDESTTAVIGRVGAAPAVELARPHPIKLLKLGGEIRLAFSVPPGDPLGVVVDKTARQVLLSVGVIGDVPSPSPVRFVVRAKTPGGWQTLFSQTVDTPMSWRDHLITAESFPSGASQFEFSIELAPGSEKLSASFGSVIFSGPGDESNEPRPNIVLMSLDTLGADYLGSEGELEGVSPAIDAVLRRSGSFRRAFSQYGSTLQSHRSLFSSRYPSRHAPPSLVTRLADHGYLTLAVTENGYVSSAYGFAQGFDWFDNGPVGKKIGSAMASGTFDEAADILHRLERFAPIFLFVHTYEVHNPYTPQSTLGKQIAKRHSSGDVRSYEEMDPHATDAEDRRRLWALYVGGVHDLDEQVEKFFARLATLETAADTLVVLTSDHGEGFFNSRVGHGGIHNDVLRVPLGFHWPGHIPARMSSGPVELVDVMPTILDFARVPAGESLDGRSLAARLRSEEALPDTADTAFSRSRKQGDAIQTERFKLISNGDPGTARLYDLENDPSENTDVSAQYPEHAQRLLALLELRTRALDESPPPATGQDEIDSQTHERLRALGYIE